MFRYSLNVPPHGCEGVHADGMYSFACHVTNEIIHDNNMYSFENGIIIRRIQNNIKPIHIVGVAAAKPPPPPPFGGYMGLM